MRTLFYIDDTKERNKIKKKIGGSGLFIAT